MVGPDGRVRMLLGTGWDGVFEVWNDMADELSEWADGPYVLMTDEGSTDPIFGRMWEA